MLLMEMNQLSGKTSLTSTRHLSPITHPKPMDGLLGLFTRQLVENPFDRYRPSRNTVNLRKLKANYKYADSLSAVRAASSHMVLHVHRQNNSD